VSSFYPGGSPVHVATVTKSLVLLLFFQAEFLLVGVTFLSYWGSGRYARFKLFDQAFVGYCLVSGFAQLWSVFGGLRPFSNFCLIGGTLVLATLNRQRVANDLSEGVARVRFRALLVLVPIGFSVAFNVLTSDFCYDGLLYHHLSVRWITEYGSVPGLANLHGRLGFNSSLTALAGIFSVPFGVPIGREFANGATTFLVVCVLSQGLTFKNLTALSSCRNLYAFGLLTFLLMLVVSPCLSSPQPDVGSAAIMVAAAWYFFEFLVSHRTADLEAANHLFLCVAASVAAFELKISYIGFAAATILAALGIASRRGGFIPPIVFCLSFSAGLLVPWMSCGYITSGCPFYPSEIGRLGFDWAVPHELASLEKDAAIAWARMPGLPPVEALRNWEWITPWSIRVLGNSLMVKPMLVAVVGLSLMLARFLMPPRPEIERSWFFLLVPCSAGLCFWFLTAPDPRFAQATLWIFALNILLFPLLISGSFSRSLVLTAALVLAIVAVFDTGIGVVRLIREKKSFPNIVRGQADLSARRTDSGLAVWIPKNVYEPGFAQLVSTPPDRFNPGLELRDSNLRDGFRIRASNRPGMKVPEVDSSQNH
jgi:hypothetical protein